MRYALMTVSLAACAIGGCNAAKAYQRMGFGIKDCAETDLVKGKQLKHTYADGAPLFKTKEDFEKWISNPDGNKVAPPIGKVAPTDTVTALEDRQDCGADNAGWVYDSRLGKVFIFLSVF